jgi:RNA polymerase sigma-70 factor (ECF subfamily)
MREVTLSDIERLRAETAERTTDAVPLEMDEEAFRGFYERTAPRLRAYLLRVSAEAAVADDLLQESYYRFLRARGQYEGEAHRRNALFRIATNLLHDRRRQARHSPVFTPVDRDPVDPSTSIAESTARTTDLRRAMAHLKPRERELLWLAYAQGSSHREIAECLGLRTGSVKLLLFRARRRLATLLRCPLPTPGERSLL